MIITSISVKVTPMYDEHGELLLEIEAYSGSGKHALRHYARETDLVSRFDWYWSTLGKALKESLNE
jgi:hypothetical protein